MGLKYIFIGRRRYYLYDSYNSRNKAYQEALRMRKKNGSRYYIKTRTTFMFCEPKYDLYLTKCGKFTIF